MEKIGEEQEESDVYFDICKTPEEFVSPRELFEVMLPSDGAVSFVAMIDQFEHSANVLTKNGLTTDRFKAILTNNKDWRCQLTIWGDNVERLKHVFNTSNVIHVIGAYSQLKHSSSAGNIPCDISVKDYTTINVIGRMLKEKICYDYKEITLSDVLCYNNQLVQVNAYLKSKFIEEPTQNPPLLASVGFDRTRFEIRCNDRDIIDKFNVGSMLKMNGLVVANKMPCYLLIKKATDVTLLPDAKLSKIELAKAVFLPHKRVLEDVEMAPTTSKSSNQ